MEHYNRVLVINSQSMFKNNATGITLRSLWGDWPKDKILEFYSEPVQNNTSYSYKLEDNFFQWMIHLVKRIRRKRTGASEGKVQSHENSSDASGVSDHLKRLLNCFPLKVTRKDWIRIRKFHPEIVYTLGGSANILSLTDKIARKMDIPVTVHYMDNWPNKIRISDTGFEKIYHRILLGNLKKNLKRSEICFAISPYMSECYEKEFRVRHISLMNCVNVKLLSETHRKRLEDREVINIVYAGGLHLNRWKKLKIFAEFMLNEKFHTKLLMYVSDHEKVLYKDEFPKENCEFMKMISHDRISDLYKNADVLLHVEADDEENIPFIKYSISTKIPEYLATGKPFIFFGPSDIAMYRYLKENEIAYAVCRNKDLKYVLAEVLHDMKLGKYRYGEEAVKFAQDYHSYSQVREKLRESLETAVESFNQTSDSQLRKRADHEH